VFQAPVPLEAYYFADAILGVSSAATDSLSRWSSRDFDSTVEDFKASNFFFTGALGFNNNAF
jgi:hypothetical protein